MGLKYTKRAMTSYEVHRFFHGLEISFFPDTFFVCLLKFYSALVICQVIVLITNKTTPTITNSKKMPLATSKK